MSGCISGSCLDKHGHWTNPWPTWRWLSILLYASKFLLSSLLFPQVLDGELPVLEPHFVQNPEASDPPAGMRVTWLLHATVPVEMEGVNILMPESIISSVHGAQTIQRNSLRGKTPSSSASHHDHLDAGSVASLNAGMCPKWFGPLGLMDWLAKMGSENVMEENCVPGHNVTFVCTLEQPDTGLFWVPTIDSSSPATGYCPSFQEIGRRFGPFDLAAIPNGAYLPRDVMKGQHVDPEEAVQIHQDLQAKLTYENYLEPTGLKPESFFTLLHGESRLIAAQDRDVFDCLQKQIFH
uniref:N-acyl phosphatidylethanolamine phospholipase D n=1 Tax=Poecilia reticulata TaxID=8081 RepID=A0A3P9QEF1_POERE